MALLNMDYLRFNKKDVQLMQKMLKQFHEFHEGVGMPDFSNSYIAYLPVFAIALLASQEGVDKLTRRLVKLTWVIIALTIALTALTLIMAIRVA